MKKYANAKDVLPGNLYEQVKSHFTGLLYIPGEPTRDPGKREIVISLAKQGASVQEIANIMDVSTRRVNQILAGRRKRKVEYVWDE
ncbi:MAG: hypothetical protein PHH77_05780 [Victivallaceae bacterium]|nr:hypothetical protein [Victivallaceae bacterium]